MNLNDIDSGEIARVIEQTSNEVKSFIKKHSSATDDIRARLQELEQKNDAASFGGRAARTHDDSDLVNSIMGSDGLKSFLAGNTQGCSIQVPTRFLTKTQIFNSSGSAQPLVQADRRPGIASPPQQRLTIRGLFAQVPTTSNAVEFTSETGFANNAAPQGGNSPQGNGERRNTRAPTHCAGLALARSAHGRSSIG